MKRSKLPKSTFELALLKERLNSDVLLQEQALGTEAMRLRSSFVAVLKNTAIIQTQKLAILFLMKLMNR